MMTMMMMMIDDDGASTARGNPEAIRWMTARIRACVRDDAWANAMVRV